MRMNGLVLLALVAIALQGSVHAERSDNALPQLANSVTKPGPSLQLLVDAIGTRNLVLLGEMHGTTEVPALVGDLAAHQVAAGEQVVLALEITSVDQLLVERFIASAGKKSDRDAFVNGEHWQDTNHDGRDSQAMLALIEHVRELRKGGADVMIDFFDVPGDGERDRRMADHLRGVVKRYPNAMVVVLTGNIHAMIAPPSWKMFNAGKQMELPMTAGQHLSDLHPLSINVSAAGGDVWNCRDEGCRVYAMKDNGPISKPSIKFTEPPASPWNATLTLPAFTASPPVLPASGN